MAVAFRAVGTFVTAGATSVSVPYPAGVASGDLLLIHYLGNGAVTVSTPAGWTLLFGPVTGAASGFRSYVWWRVAGGSEPGSVTITSAGVIRHDAYMSAWTGCDGTTPVDVSATATLATSGTTCTAPSVTTTKANTQLLHLYWGYINTSAGGITPNASDTERYDSYEANLNTRFELADKAQAATGATGTSAATLTGETLLGGLAATVALAPVSSVTWNGSSTVSLTDTVTTAGTRLGVTVHGATITTATVTVTTVSRAVTLHASSAVSETVTVTTRAALLRMILVPRSPGLLVLAAASPSPLVLVPRPPDSLVLTPR